MTLPVGFSINPNAADGKTACTDAEAMFGTKEEAHCPEFSKVGSLEIDSSALPGRFPGFLYLGQPLAGQPLPRVPHGRRLQHPRQAGGNRDRRTPPPVS